MACLKTTPSPVMLTFEQILFGEFDSMPLQQLNVSITKRPATMMYFLILSVTSHLGHI